jgi:hypothetical protein
MELCAKLIHRIENKILTVVFICYFTHTSLQAPCFEFISFDNSSTQSWLAVSRKHSNAINIPTPFGNEIGEAVALWSLLLI